MWIDGLKQVTLSLTKGRIYIFFLGGGGEGAYFLHVIDVDLWYFVSDKFPQDNGIGVHIAGQRH